MSSSSAFAFCGNCPNPVQAGWGGGTQTIHVSHAEAWNHGIDRWNSGSTPFGSGETYDKAFWCMNELIVQEMAGPPVEYVYDINVCDRSSLNPNSSMSSCCPSTIHFHNGCNEKYYAVGDKFVQPINCDRTSFTTLTGATFGSASASLTSFATIIEITGSPTWNGNASQYCYDFGVYNPSHWGISIPNSSVTPEMTQCLIPLKDFWPPILPPPPVLPPQPSHTPPPPWDCEPECNCGAPDPSGTKYTCYTLDNNHCHGTLVMETDDAGVPLVWLKHLGLPVPESCATRWEGLFHAGYHTSNFYRFDWARLYGPNSTNWAARNLYSWGGFGPTANFTHIHHHWVPWNRGHNVPCWLMEEIHNHIQSLKTVGGLRDASWNLLSSALSSVYNSSCSLSYQPWNGTYVPSCSFDTTPRWSPIPSLDVQDWVHHPFHASFKANPSFEGRYATYGFENASATIIYPMGRNRFDKDGKEVLYHPDGRPRYINVWAGQHPSYQGSGMVKTYWMGSSRHPNPAENGNCRRGYFSQIGCAWGWVTEEALWYFHLPWCDPQNTSCRLHASNLSTTSSFAAPSRLPHQYLPQDGPWFVKETNTMFMHVVQDSLTPVEDMYGRCVDDGTIKWSQRQFLRCPSFVAYGSSHGWDINDVAKIPENASMGAGVDGVANPFNKFYGVWYHKPYHWGCDKRYGCPFTNNAIGFNPKLGFTGRMYYSALQKCETPKPIGGGAELGARHPLNWIGKPLCANWGVDPAIMPGGVNPCRPTNAPWPQTGGIGWPFALYANGAFYVHGGNLNTYPLWSKIIPATTQWEGCTNPTDPAYKACYHTGYMDVKITTSYACGDNIHYRTPAMELSNARCGTQGFWNAALFIGTDVAGHPASCPPLNPQLTVDTLVTQVNVVSSSSLASSSLACYAFIEDGNVDPLTNMLPVIPFAVNYAHPPCGYLEDNVCPIHASNYIPDWNLMNLFISSSSDYSSSSVSTCASYQCWRAKADHNANIHLNYPLYGSNWQSYWELVPCEDQCQPSPSTAGDNTNLFLGNARHNFDRVCDFIAANSNRGPDCVQCYSPSSSSSSSSSSSGSSLSSVFYNYYDFYECGNYQVNDCSRLYGLSSPDAIVRVNKTNDTISNNACSSSGAARLEYKITKLNNLFTAEDSVSQNSGSQEFRRTYDLTKIMAPKAGIYSGSVTVNYNAFTVSDRFKVYYGTAKIYDSGQVTGQGQITVNFQGASSVIQLVVNEGGSTTGPPWTVDIKITGSGADPCGLLIRNDKASAAIFGCAPSGKHSHCKDCSSSTSPSAPPSQAPPTPQPECSSASCISTTTPWVVGQHYYGCNYNTTTGVFLCNPLAKSVAHKGKCYIGKVYAGALATTQNEPGAGTGWASYWCEYNCCPSSSSSFSVSPAPSQEPKSSSSADVTSSSSSASPRGSNFSSVTKCYIAKTSNMGEYKNQPGVGPSWTAYWEECPCCPSFTITPNPSDTCPLFHVDKEELRGPWTNREPEYNRNLTITQGDTVCYQFAVYEDGLPLDVTGMDVKSHIKLKFSDVDPIQSFAANLVPNTINVIELSMDAKNTACLPVHELVYSCEIRNMATAISADTSIRKVIQGYLRVLPEVTRGHEVCSLFTFVKDGHPSSSSSSPQPSPSPYCCPEFKIARVIEGNKYVFNVEVPTEEAVFKDVSHWEVELKANASASAYMKETELVQNEINPNKVNSGYDMVYPIGGGMYRFIDKLEFLSTGTLKSIFSAPILISEYQSAELKVKFFTNSGCQTKWCYASLHGNQNTALNDCCVSSSTSPPPSQSPSPSPSQSPSPSPSLNNSSSSSFSAMAKGACCMFINNTHQCVTLTAYNCSLVSGKYLGDGVSCNPNPCSSDSPSLSPSPSPSTSPSTSPSAFVPQQSSSSASPFPYNGWWVELCTDQSMIFVEHHSTDTQLSDGRSNEYVKVYNNNSGTQTCAKLLTKDNSTSNWRFYGVSAGGTTFTDCLCNTENQGTP